MIGIKPQEFMIDGFLSRHLAISVASNQSATTQKLAEICVDLNRLSLKRLQQVSLNTEDPVSLISVLLVAQATTSFESAVILASIGMEGEARSMIRRCIEAAIICCALVRQNKINVIDYLVNDKYNHNKKLMNSISKSLNLSEDNLFFIKLKEHVGNLENPTIDKPGLKLNLEKLADAANIKHIYDIIFRHLSADASHPTLDSLKKLVEHNQEDGAVIGMSIRPRFDELGLTLLMAAISQLLAIESFQIKYPEIEVEKIVAAHAKTLGYLYKEMYPEWADVLAL